MGWSGFSLWVSRILFRSPFPLALTCCEWVNEFFCRFWYRLRRLGPCTVPASGAVIVTANHSSTPDPLYLCAACPYRKISFMIAREYANYPVWRFFVKLVECIQVRRDGRDIAATKEALRRLRRGDALGIFIEGHIPHPGETCGPKDGVALLALRSGATVIPAYIEGTIYKDGILEGFLTRHRVHIRFGPPVDLSDLAGRDGREAVSAATQRIYQRICDLAGEE